MALLLCCGSRALAERAAETLDESVSLLQITRELSQQLSQVDKVCPPTAKLMPSDGQPDDFFGTEASMSAGGARVAVTAYGDDDKGDTAGSVYVFQGASGKELRKLTALDGAAGDQFGQSVSMSSDGAHLAVGAYSANEGRGSAYVFDVVTGEQLFKLMAADAAVDDRFGWSVSISPNGSYLAVGALGRPSGANPGPGGVYLFNASTGRQLMKVAAPDWPVAGYDFGCSVSMSSGGAHVAAGARFSRAAYVFDARTGGWIAKLTPEDGNPGDWFGNQVAINADGSLVAVGAPFDDDMGTSAGAVYVFNVASGTQLRKFTAADGSAYDMLATHISLSSDGALVAAGAFYDDGVQGSTYVFDVGAGRQLAKLTAPDGGAFGTGVSFGPDSRRLSVGASVVASKGAAYVFDMLCVTPAAPTAAPTPPPTEGATATGDPHVTNVDGARFEIWPGVHELLRLPRRASRHRGSVEPEPLLSVLASVERADDDACHESYVRQLDMVGGWLNSSGPLRFRAEGGGLDAARAIRLSVNGSLVDPQALGRDRRVHPFLEMSGPKDLPADRVSTAIRKVPMFTVKLIFAAATLKIDWMHRVVPGRPALNHLNFQALGLRKFLGSTGMDIGGILGRDDHGDAASLPDECKPLGADLRVSHRAPGEEGDMQVIAAAL